MMPRLCCLLILAAVLPAAAADRFVTNRNDSGAGSLRQAITSANNSPGPDTILITAIPDAGLGGTVVTIALNSPLPPITGPLLIDGTSAINYSAASGRPVVVLDGALAGAGAVGLDVTAPNCEVRALSLVRWNGTALRVLGTTGALVTGCWVGMHPDQTLLANSQGIVLQDASGCQLGGPGDAFRNVISGNSGIGLWITGENADNNLVWNTRIGTTPDGEFAAPNAGDGIEINGGDGNIIGGSGALACRIGRSGAGIRIMTGADDTQILGCDIGLSASLADLGNRSDGIVSSGSARLLISGCRIGWNASAGIRLTNDPVTGMNTDARIVACSIGRGAGISPAPNGFGGIIIDAAPFTVIGTAAAPNEISGNAGSQVRLVGAGADGCVFHGNTISGGLNLTGAVHGIEIVGSRNVQIGGLAAGQANNISLNRSVGITITRATALPPAPDRIPSGIRIAGNFISGISEVGSNGISITAGDNIEILGNFIYNHGTYGIVMAGPSTRLNVVTGNAIGQNVGNAADVGNSTGIALIGARENTIGTAANPNTIISSRGAGILLRHDSSGNPARANTIRGNGIGITVAGQAGWFIQPHGISLQQPGADNIIGGAGVGEGNTFAGNQIGIVLSEKEGSDGTLTIQGNRFGTQPGVDFFRNHNALFAQGVSDILFTNNTVSFGVGTGVIVTNHEESAPDRVQITANTFTDNAGIPIDLGGDGPDPQDGAAGDPDIGPNGKLDHPEILSVRLGTNVEVTGRVRTTPFALVRVHLGAGPRRTAAGFTFTEPQTQLGSSPPVLTDARGHAYFRVSVSTPIAADAWLTATTTRVEDSPGSTSEFSPGVSYAVLRDRPWGVLDIRRDGNDILVDVPTLPGLPTEVRTNAGLTGPWSPLSSFTGTGAIITVRHPGAITAGPRLFYRAQEER